MTSICSPIVMHDIALHFSKVNRGCGFKLMAGLSCTYIVFNQTGHFLYILLRYLENLGALQQKHIKFCTFFRLFRYCLRKRKRHILKEHNKMSPPTGNVPFFPLL